MENGDCFNRGEIFNPILTMAAQVSCLLVISHVFQLLLKPLGQPAPVAQILAGFVLGPSCLSHIERVKMFFLSSSSNNFFETMILYARITIMFQIGLETDVPYLWRNLRRSFVISFASSLVCTIFALLIADFIFQEMGAHGSIVIIALTLAVILSNTASPFVVRLAHDLKFATTDLGRLAISASLITDAYASVLLIIIIRSKHQYNVRSGIGSAILCLVIIVTVVVAYRRIVNWMNWRNRNAKNLRNTEVFVLLAILFIAATALETLGYSSITVCFLIGASFPRGGKTGRTLSSKLTYSVHNFILPIYFGYSGFKADVTIIDSFRNLAVIAIIVLLSIGGKVTGTLVACVQLKIPLNEGVLIAFLMNLKGHVDMLALSVGLDDKVKSSEMFYSLMVVAVVINSLTWGPVVAFMVRREREMLDYKPVALEFQTPDGELKVLAGVHNPRPVATMIGLISSFKGSENLAITPYLMHLVELPERTGPSLLYHQKEEDELSDEESYGGNDVIEINEAVDIFAAETGMIINQVKLVSPYATMSDDVCKFLEKIRASIIILPFHKHQRIDGILESGKEGIRMTNQKVLCNAKCSVAILVDRGLTGGAGSRSGSLQHIAMLFFGGPDDREALALGKRLGLHHHVNLTVIRFHNRSPNKEMAISSNLESFDNDEDVATLSEFFHRYVTSGQAGYVEKCVEDGQETASYLRDMADVYSMYIVGRGGGGTATLLTDSLSDWEECPELGRVGDFLASAEFDHCGSVLVVQQRRISYSLDEDR